MRYYIEAYRADGTQILGTGSGQNAFNATRPKSTAARRMTPCHHCGYVLRSDALPVDLFDGRSWWSPEGAMRHWRRYCDDTANTADDVAKFLRTLDPRPVFRSCGACEA